MEIHFIGQGLKRMKLQIYCCDLSPLAQDYAAVPMSSLNNMQRFPRPTVMYCVTPKTKHLHIQCIQASVCRYLLTLL